MARTRASKPNSQVFNLLKEFMSHLRTVRDGNMHGRILLAGDPGIGKTTFTKTLAEILGLKLITIEIPHVSEEHLINIPFIVINPTSENKEHGKIQLEPVDTTNEDEEGGDYKLVLAQSNLYSILQSARNVSDAEYLKHMNEKAKPHVKELYAALGGTATEIPEQIVEIRKHHTTILFLDEYWRQTTMRIRNILREILNNNIGTHKIPKSTYIVYASNMRDAGGLDAQPPNSHFKTVEFSPPTKEEWFKWLKSEFANHEGEHVKLKPEVVEAFEKGMTDADISVTHGESEVRTSPRRWAQLILYVNSSIPVKDEKDAKSLLHNVGNYFIHYATEEHNEELRDRIKHIVAGIIKKTSDIKNVDKNTKNEDDEWRDSFDHYIREYMKGAGTRQHVPIISGPPGIGKTMFAQQVASNNNLLLIEIPSSGLSSEDIIGMPLPGEKTKDGSMTVKFSIPKLYRQVKTKIKEEEANHFAGIRDAHKDDPKAAEAEIEAFKKQKWKYLIFFDEINTVGDDKTFNALRRVLLEKNFGPGNKKDAKGNHLDLEIPKEAVVFAAINPEGSHTRTLTDHFKDVIDVIPAKANWDHTKKWLASLPVNKRAMEHVPEVAMNIIEQMIDRFQTTDDKIPAKRKPFTFEIDHAKIQITPREYSDMYASLVDTIDDEMKEIQKDYASADPEAITQDRDELITDLSKVVGKSLENSLNNNFYREEMPLERDEFASRLPTWVKSLGARTFDSLLSKKIETSKSTAGALGPYFEGKKSLLKMPHDEHILLINQAATNKHIIEELEKLFLEHITTKEDFTDFLVNQNEKLIELDADGETLKYGSEKTNKYTNFVLAMIFTLHVHGFSNDRLTAIATGFNLGLNAPLRKMKTEGIIDHKADYIKVMPLTVATRKNAGILIKKLAEEDNAK